MKKKRTGFTLVELLVVIAIIALLMGILMPALAKVRQIAYRMVCASNIGGIGKAMMVYANDNKEAYPVAGGPRALWQTTGKITNWIAPAEADAFQGEKATITSCFYLLVKFAEMPPKQFVCKGDLGIREMKMSEFPSLPPKTGGRYEFPDFWDFSGDQGGSPYYPGEYCSYSYQLPYPKDLQSPTYRVTATSQPDTPVVADRNPIFDKNAAPGFNANNQKGTKPSCVEPEGTLVDPDKTLNSACHQKDGQNVLFNDSHVSFELNPCCGIEKDNIWVPWAKPDVLKQCELVSLEQCKKNYKIGATQNMPQSDKDAFLVNEYNGTPP